MDEGSGYDSGESVSEAVKVRYYDERGSKHDFVVREEDPTWTSIEFGFSQPRALDFEVRDGVLLIRWGR